MVEGEEIDIITNPGLGKILLARPENEKLNSAIHLKQLPERVIVVNDNLVLLYPDRYTKYDGKDFIDYKLAHPMWEEFDYAVFNSKIYFVYGYDYKLWLTILEEGNQSEPILVPFPGLDAHCCRIKIQVFQDKLYFFHCDNDFVSLMTFSDGKFSDWQNIGNFPCGSFQAFATKEDIFLISSYSPVDKDYGLIQVGVLEKGRVEKIMEANFGLEDDYSYYRNICVTSASRNKIELAGLAKIGGSSKIAKVILTKDQPIQIVKLFTTFEFPELGFWFLVTPAIPFFAFPLITLLLAIIATFMMPRYRPVMFRSDSGQERNYASPIRRLLSELIDLAIIFAPFSFWLINLLDYSSRDISAQMLNSLEIAGVIFAWLILVLFYFIWLEGKYGATIGKWLFRIEVLGENLKPCGIKRAVARNFLKFFDGFIYVIVGIVCMAFTDKWQKICDLAAGTVVVRRAK